MGAGGNYCKWLNYKPMGKLQDGFVWQFLFVKELSASGKKDFGVPEGDTKNMQAGPSSVAVLRRVDETPVLRFSFVSVSIRSLSLLLSDSLYHACQIWMTS